MAKKQVTHFIKLQIPACHLCFPIIFFYFFKPGKVKSCFLSHTHKFAI